MAFPYLHDLLEALTGLSVPLPLPTFGACVLIAILAAVWVARSELLRMQRAGQLEWPPATPLATSGPQPATPAWPAEVAWELASVVVIAGLVGARLASILEVPRAFLADPWGMIFSREGFNFLGGLALGAGAGAWYVRRRRLPLARVCDVCAPALMLGYAIGRIGCQLAGDGDWGIAANPAAKPHWLPLWLWAQTYRHNIIGAVIPPPGVYPTPIYETLMCLLLFGVIWAVRKHPFRPGWLFSLYLVLCGAERLLIEPIRVNPRAHVLGIAASQAQIISAALVVIGIAALAALTRHPPGRLVPQPAGDPLEH